MINFNHKVKNFKIILIVKTLKENNYNISKTSRVLRIPRRTIYNIMGCVDKSEYKKLYLFLKTHLHYIDDITIENGISWILNNNNYITI